MTRIITGLFRKRGDAEKKLSSIWSRSSASIGTSWRSTRGGRSAAAPVLA